jgi:hypothetical protein
MTDERLAVLRAEGGNPDGEQEIDVLRVADTSVPKPC